MSDITLRVEVEKRIVVLEAQYEMIQKDLEVARNFLAILDRETFGVGIPIKKPSTHAEIVEEAVIDILAGVKSMHRQDILDGVLSKRIHIGNDHDNRKQLATLSSILSRSPHFIPTGNGHWVLATRPTNEYEYEEYVQSGEEEAQTGLQRGQRELISAG